MASLTEMMLGGDVVLLVMRGMKDDQGPAGQPSKVVLIHHRLTELIITRSPGST